MKQSQQELDPNRYYEITKVEKGAVWYAALDSSNCVVGAIVKPMKKGTSSLHCNHYRVIVDSHMSYLTVGTQRTMSKLTLRPLTIKEQEKINETRRDAA